MKPFQWVLWFCIGVLSVLLSGCGDSNIQNVKEWMSDVRRHTKTVTGKVSESKQYVPYAYGAKDMPDPFNSSKILTALVKMQAKSSSGIQPDLNRRKEALENFPLDTVKMVGTLEKPGVRYALLLVDRTLYKAKAGNYVGQNFGLITEVNESVVELKEIVQNTSGEWVERKSRLELQEGKK